MAPDDKPDYESLIPFTRRVIKEFGPNRMVWKRRSAAHRRCAYEGLFG